MEGSTPMPQRPRSHQLEKESRVAFEKALPSRFVYRPADDPDYGIDGEVEEFDEDDRATGVRYYVQLKATDEANPSRALRRQIRLTTAAYFRAQPLPVLMVLYMATTDTLYTRWFHEFDPYYEHVGDSHLTFTWSAENAWQTDTPKRLVREARRVTAAKSAALTLPIHVVVQTPADGAHGSTPMEIELAVSSAASKVPNILQVVDDESALLRLTCQPDLLSASFGGVSTMTMHLNPDDPERSPDDLAIDLLACASLSLARVGHADVASRIGVQFFTDSLVAGLPPIATDLAVAMAHAERLNDVLDIAERLDQEEESGPRSTSVVFIHAALQYPGTLQTHDRDRLEKVLQARLDRRLSDGDLSWAAAASENIGRHYLKIQDYARAAETLARCTELDTAYASENEHYWPMLGGAYFLSGDFPGAIDAYDEALRRPGSESDPWIEARRADALMFAGRYEDARKAFSAIQTDDLGLSAWAYVKARALWWIITETGYENQDRSPEEATGVARKSLGAKLSHDELDRLTSEIWALDALSGLGWFNRGVDLVDRGSLEDAMHAFLAAAVLQEGDVEAWVNIAILATQVGDDDLCTTSVISGGRLNKDAYLPEFARQLRETVSDLTAREEILAGIKQVLDRAAAPMAEPRPIFVPKDSAPADTDSD